MEVAYVYLAKIDDQPKCFRGSIDSSWSCSQFFLGFSTASTGTLSTLMDPDTITCNNLQVTSSIFYCFLFFKKIIDLPGEQINDLVWETIFSSVRPKNALVSDP